MSWEDAARSTAPTLKLSKENFVSYHSGTNLTELCFLFALVPFLAFMLQSHSRPCQSGFVRVVLQSAWVVLPTVLAVMSDTLVCAWLLFVLVLMSVTACWSRLPRYVAMTRSLHHLAEQHSKRSGTDSKAFEPVLACATSNVTPAQHSYITSVRGTTVLCTAICILAVDFHAFPRRFCKAEKFGQGLMDIGVGAFIFSSGISTRAAPLSECAKPYKGIVRSLERNSVLLILGLVRMCSVKTLEYQEHVGEYGVHWNFFLTVAAVSTVMALVPIPKSRSIAAGSVVLVVHQVALSCGLIGVVHAEARGPALWHLNKEGVLSLPGYWALSLLSVGLSSHLHPECASPHLTRAKLADRDVWLWLRKLVVITGLLWAALFGAQWVQPTSRRACNMPYVMLSLALNWMMLVLFITGCLLSNSCQPVFLLEACSRNMLWLFLLANVMTGAINMTINSLLVSTGHAIGVVCAYMFTICCVACAMHSNNLRFDMTYMSFKSTVKERA